MDSAQTEDRSWCLHNGLVYGENIPRRMNGVESKIFTRHGQAEGRRVRISDGRGPILVSIDFHRGANDDLKTL